MSFRQYVQSRRVGDNPAGDFVQDARSDRGLPDARSWDELERYLLRRGARIEAIEAAKIVWRGCQAKVRREGRDAETP